jgi:hypothetical protein
MKRTHKLGTIYDWGNIKDKQNLQGMNGQKKQNGDKAVRLIMNLFNFYDGTSL